MTKFVKINSKKLSACSRLQRIKNCRKLAGYCILSIHTLFCSIMNWVKNIRLQTHIESISMFSKIVIFTKTNKVSVFLGSLEKSAYLEQRSAAGIVFVLRQKIGKFGWPDYRKPARFRCSADAQQGWEVNFLNCTNFHESVFLAVRLN